MTPEEVELLQHAGNTILYNMSTTVAQFVSYGLYIAIYSLGVRALLKRKPWTRDTWTLFSFLTILCLILTVNLATGVAFNADLIRGSMIDNPEKSLAERFQLADVLVSGVDDVQIWSGGGNGGGFLFAFADAVVVWRACVLWPGNKTVRILLWASLFASFGSALASSALETVLFSGKNTVPTESPAAVMVILSQSMSLATNAVATMLIGYKAYYHRQMMKATNGVRRSRSSAILMFMAESGVVYCVLQAVLLGLNTANSGDFTVLDYTAGTWQQITLFAAASYPVLVLIIIDSHRSFSDSTGGSTADSGFARGSNAILSHLSFAVRPSGNSTSGDEIVDVDSTVRSRVDPTISVDKSDEGSSRVQDTEKGEGSRQLEIVQVEKWNLQ